jgi:hypothetical protein
MRKLVLSSLLLGITSTISVAGPCIIDFVYMADPTAMYQDAGYTTPVQNGWYAEVILQATAAAYNSGSYATYDIAGGSVGTLNNPNQYIGFLADGSAWVDGWVNEQVAFSSAGSYYATWRVYNNSDKAKASKYLVIPTWTQFTSAPSKAGDPATSDTVVWADAGTDKGYMQYDVPAVPEPATMALFGLGGLALVIRRKIRKEV